MLSAATLAARMHLSRQPEGRLSPTFLADAFGWSRAALGP